MVTTENKIICSKCNNELPSDSGFCQYCGNKIEAQIVDDNSNQVEITEESISDEVITPVVENETAAKILASGIIEGQKAMEANKEIQSHNELDADFGLVPHKPIYTVGIDEQEKYLKSLRTINGEQIKWNRRGSMSVDGVNGMVDVYDTYLPSGEEYKTVYINMYGASNSTFAPKGFSYSNQTTATPISPIKKQNVKKSKKLKIALLITGVVAIVAIFFFVFAISEINYQRANTLLNEDKYDAARLAFIDLGNYRDSEDLVDECTYQKACSLLDNGSYDSAIKLFKELGNYSNSKDMLNECTYQKACSLISGISIDNYYSAKTTAKEAIDLFEGLNGYKNSNDKINEVKYKVVSNHHFYTYEGEIYYRNNDTTIFDYLRELKSQNYEDSANRYKKLYDWKVEVVAVNSSEDDDTTNQTTIKRNTPIYFHIDLSGGEPNEEIRITVKSTLPNGNTTEYTFETKWDTYSAGWYGWSEGLYSTGTLRCYFYDEDGNMIGAGSVKIVE